MERYAGLTCEAIAKRSLPEGFPSGRDLRDLRKKALKQFWSYLNHRSYLKEEGRDPYATDWKYGGVKITGKVGHNKWTYPQFKGQKIEITGGAFGMREEEILSIKIGGRKVATVLFDEDNPFVLRSGAGKEEGYPTLRRTVNAAVVALQNAIRD